MKFRTAFALAALVSGATAALWRFASRDSDARKRKRIRRERIRAEWNEALHGR